MSAADLFNSFRAYKREQTGNASIPLTQAEVDAINALLKSLGWSQGVATKLDRPDLFFAHVRAAHGRLTEEQVAGFNALLDAMGAARWPLAWVAYGLATAWWETAKSMQPVEEAYYLGAKAAAYRKTLRYYPWHGRGYPQTTWERNYRWADEELGLNGALLANPDLMLTTEVAAPTMIKGMEQGAFTGKALKDYLPISGQAGHDAYKRARKIINGTDKDAEIAKLALGFEAALVAGGWA